MNMKNKQELTEILEESFAKVLKENSPFDPLKGRGGGPGYRVRTASRKEAQVLANKFHTLANKAAELGKLDKLEMKLTELQQWLSDEVGRYDD